LLVVMLGLGADQGSSVVATQNGVSLTCQKTPGNLIRAYHYYCYLVAPTSGTFSISWPTGSGFQYGIYTLQNAAQTSPIDIALVNDSQVSTSSLTTSVTTTVGYDLFLDNFIDSIVATHTFGAGQTQTFMGGSDPLGKNSESYKAASVSPGTELMVRNFSPNDSADDLAVIAVKPGGTVFSTTTANVYTYAGTGYANPDAVTQIGNGLSTTTYGYDNNGNLTSAGTGAATTTYTYDYGNRLIALFAGGATTTYGYDAFGARVLQTGTTTTTFYPFKWYSVASSTGTGAKFSTSTSYMFNGDTLLATVDQQLASGVATGTAKTRYVHPDHLGSTNVVTDENDNLVQTLDYYPYGATRVSVSTSTNEKRKYIDQFSDDSGLSYLNARYYNPNQGQFLTEDPTFLAVGNPNQLQQLTQQQQQQLLSDPQTLNSYGYARDNPIVNKDATGLISRSEFELLYKALNGASGLETISSYNAALNTSGKRPEHQAADRAQAQYDAGTFIASTAVTYGFVAIDPIAGVAIDAGNFYLMGYDKYCATRVCRDFSQSQNVTAGQILSSIPTGKTADYTLSNKTSSNGSNGAPIWGVRSSAAPTTNTNNGKSNGGSSSSSLIGLYQSLVATLTAYISVLTSNKH
jgi:RHS repeat-associated protein